MLRIAIVEDEHEYSNLLSSYISRYALEQDFSYDSATFSDGVTFLTGYQPIYDIIFMDIQMVSRHFLLILNAVVLHKISHFAAAAAQKLPIDGGSGL